MVTVLNRKKLSDADINQRLSEAPGWRYANGKLRREFSTGNFNKGVQLVVKISGIADQLNHHPDVILTYPRVAVEIYTHDVGGITDFDFELAKRIGALEP